jgi:hypothetical protein
MYFTNAKVESNSVLNKKNNQVSVLPTVFTQPYYLEK